VGSFLLIWWKTETGVPKSDSSEITAGDCLSPGEEVSVIILLTELTKNEYKNPQVR
jgi:hypothetical protein